MIGNKKTRHQTTIPTEDSQPSHHLPQEIIFDILSRLLVKHLLRFRSVCKSWLSLISNHQFVKSHLSRASNMSDRRLVLNAYPYRTGLKSCSLDSVMECKLPENAVEFDYPSKEPNQFVYIVGSCNGLMCVAACVWNTNKRTIYLWNPSTRKSKRLPDLGVKRMWDYQVLYGFGLGFDESNDDYKVVLIFRDSGGGVSDERKVMVYTLRTDSWRQIGGFSCDVPFGFIGKFLNGSIHWVVCDNSGSSYSSVIVSLDLEKEMYNEVLLPNYGADVFHLELCVLKGSIGSGTFEPEAMWKALGRTRILVELWSVCRSGLSLISNHQFVKSHLSIASNTSDQRLVLNAYPNRTGLKSCSLDSVMEFKLPENAVEFDYPSKGSNRLVFIVGSCNGLICVATYMWTTYIWTIYLLNPSTRKSKRLPDLGVKRMWDYQDFYGFGLGFDESRYWWWGFS
ncbi:hypothetical protein RHMOL_Rhmol09G0062700 [Rhododendron molle]|uniref:Uncharacterized protein n=1 Tax=Rhododendron molle TaxID=49168 RepID=A0ACC0MA69_RHOML|nr:hypothetical protein RHMOL_Rhmol09G0062700 [Rhododendron molle]